MNEREALGDALMGALCESVIWENRHIGELEYHLCDEIASRILASDWLRDHDAALVAQARSDALREAADALDRPITSVEQVWSPIVATWLRARAAASSHPTGNQP